MQNKVELVHLAGHGSLPDATLVYVNGEFSAFNQSTGEPSNALKEAGNIPIHYRIRENEEIPHLLTKVLQWKMWCGPW